MSRSLIYCFGILLAVSSQATRAVSLEILNNCALLREMHSVASREFPRSMCLARSGWLINSIVERLDRHVDSLCILELPPAGMDDGFGCIQIQLNQASELVCLREVASDSVVAYRREYRQDGARTARMGQAYLRDASNCPISNGDAAAAQSTLMPFSLAFAAEFQFGFVVPVGGAGHPDGRVLHAFANIDPRLQRASQSLEVVYVLSGGGTGREGRNRIDSAALSIEMDEMTSFSSQLNDMYRDARAPVKVSARDYVLAALDRRSYSQSEKKDVLLSARNVVVDVLRAEGYLTVQELGLAELQEQFSQQFAKITEDQPYGLRRLNMGRPLADPIVLMRQDGLDCIDEESGSLVMAMILGTEAADGVRSDLGSLAVFLFATGECSRGRARDDRSPNFQFGAVGRALSSMSLSDRNER